MISRFAGWKFEGCLVEGNTKPCGEWDTGEMWECPFFVELPSCGQSSDSFSGSSQHVLCVSPYPHYRKDRPTNPCLYWVNAFNGDKFNVGTASGEPESNPSYSVELAFLGMHRSYPCCTLCKLLRHP